MSVEIFRVGLKKLAKKSLDGNEIDLFGVEKVEVDIDEALLFAVSSC